MAKEQVPTHSGLQKCKMNVYAMVHQSVPDFFFQGVAAGRRTKGDLSFGRSESAIALLH